MSGNRVKVLIIDGDSGFLEEVKTELSNYFTVYGSLTGGDGLKVFAQLRPQVVIVDAGTMDIPFPDLVEDLKGLDGAVLRIATSSDYRDIENVMAAIESAHVHQYFRKPINYTELIELINARTVNYLVGRDRAVAPEVGSAYQRLHTIVDKAVEAEKLRQQLESQMVKIREVEAESFTKVKEALGEVNRARKKLADQDEVISHLQAKTQELDELKKRDIDRVEREREVLKQELEGLQDEYQQLVREKDKLSHFESDNEKLSQEIETLRDENGALQVSVQQERHKMLEEMAQERKALSEELVRMKQEAERAVTMQKERNQAELQALQVAFAEEKHRAVQQEIDKLQIQFQEYRQAGQTELEQVRKRAAVELEEFRQQQAAAQKAAIEKTLEEGKRRTAEEINRFKAEFEAERRAKLSEIEADRRRMEEELAQKKDEAERVLAVQKERNSAELKKMQDAFEEEKRQVTGEIERLKAQLEEKRKTGLAGIEEERQRVEQELAGIRARMTEEKEQLEKSVQDQRIKVEEDLHLFRESAAMEKKKLTEALEADLSARKKTAEAEVEELKAFATRELDRLKVTAQKKERELSEALIQTRRLTGEMEDQIKLMDGRIKALESEIETTLQEKDLALRELESLKADFKVAIQSREALVQEVAELRNMLK
jgi:hypothetical protein